MAAPYADYATVAYSPAFQQRLDFAMHKAAQSIVAEAGGTANHAQRRAYAQVVINRGYDVLGAALYILGDATIQTINAVAPVGSQITDAQLDGAIAGAWNALAGV